MKVRTINRNCMSRSRKLQDTVKIKMVNRNCLSQSQYTTLLSTPRGHAWTESPDLSFIIEKCRKTVGRVAKSNRRKAGKRSSFNANTAMWQHFVTQFLQSAEHSLVQSTRIILTKTLPSRVNIPDQKLSSYRNTQTEICNFLSNLNPDCDSMNWKRDSFRTLSSLVFNYIVQVLCSGRISKKRKMAQVILNKINDITHEYVTLNSPDNFLQGVQIFIANMFSPWLENSINDICSKSDRNKDSKIKKSHSTNNKPDFRKDTNFKKERQTINKKLFGIKMNRNKRKLNKMNQQNLNTGNAYQKTVSDNTINEIEDKTIENENKDSTNKVIQNKRNRLKLKSAKSVMDESGKNIEKYEILLNSVLKKRRGGKNETKEKTKSKNNSNYNESGSIKKSKKGKTKKTNKKPKTGVKATSVIAALEKTEKTFEYINGGKSHRDKNGHDEYANGEKRNDRPTTDNELSKPAVKQHTGKISGADGNKENHVMSDDGKSLLPNTGAGNTRVTSQDGIKNDDDGKNKIGAVGNRSKKSRSYDGDGALLSSGQRGGRTAALPNGIADYDANIDDGGMQNAMNNNANKDNGGMQNATNNNANKDNGGMQNATNNNANKNYGAVQNAMNNNANKNYGGVQNAMGYDANKDNSGVQNVTNNNANKNYGGVQNAMDYDARKDDGGEQNVTDYDARKYDGGAQNATDHYGGQSTGVTDDLSAKKHNSNLRRDEELLKYKNGTFDIADDDRYNVANADYDHGSDNDNKKHMMMNDDGEEFNSRVLEDTSNVFLDHENTIISTSRSSGEEYKANGFQRNDGYMQRLLEDKIKQKAPTETNICDPTEYNSTKITYKICKKEGSNYSIHKTILKICDKKDPSQCTMCRVDQ